MSKTNYLQAVISDLQRTAGPYRCAISRHWSTAVIGHRVVMSLRWRSGSTLDLVAAYSLGLNFV
jgi:hypothetical protein